MKRLFLTIMAVAVLSALVGAGTMAYFSASATSTDNTFQTGTMKLQLANLGGGWGDSASGTWSTPANWAPGETHQATLLVQNIGSVGAVAVYEDWKWIFSVGSIEEQLAKKIIVTEIKDSVPWNENAEYSVNYISNFSKANMDEDPRLSLYELATWGDRKQAGDSSTPKPWDVKVTLGPGLSGQVLPPNGGGTVGIRYTFMLDETTDDTLQGASLKIDFLVKASQGLLGWQ